VQSAHFALYKLFQNRIRYSGFKIKIPEPPNVPKCTSLYVTDNASNVVSIVKQLNARPSTTEESAAKIQEQSGASHTNQLIVCDDFTKIFVISKYSGNKLTGNLHSRYITLRSKSRILWKGRSWKYLEGRSRSQKFYLRLCILTRNSTNPATCILHNDKWIVHSRHCHVVFYLQ